MNSARHYEKAQRADKTISRSAAASALHPKMPRTPRTHATTKRFFNALVTALLTILLALPATSPTATADPTSDSSTISDISFTWTTTDNGYRIEDSRLFMKEHGDTAPSARLEFNTHGSGQYDVGGLRVEIPFRVWENRAGEMTGSVTVPNMNEKGSVAPGTTAYVYSIDDERGVVVIENNRTMNRESHVILSFDFSVGNPGTRPSLMNYVDGTVCEPPIVATISVSAPDGTLEAQAESPAIDAEMNTKTCASLTTRSRSVPVKNADGSLSFTAYTYTYHPCANSSTTQPAEFSWVTWSLDDLATGSSSQTNATSSATITGARDTSGQNVQVTVSGDNRSVTARCIDEQGGPTVCTKPLALDIDVDVAASAIPSGSAGNVAVYFKAQENVIPADHLDPEYTITDSSHTQYTWQDKEETDQLFNDTHFRASKYAGSVSQEGEHQGKWKLTELEEGNNLFWNNNNLTNEMESGQVLTRGAFPTLQSFSNSGGVWTAAVTNAADYPSRLATVEIPLPDDVELDANSLVFKLDGQNVEASYTYEDGILAVRTPNIPAHGNFTVSFSIAEGSNAGASAGSLTVQQLEPVFNPKSSATANRASRTDIFTVTNNGTATTPAGIPLELNRLQCGAVTHPTTTVTGCFDTNIHSYRALLNGEEIDVYNETSPRAYSHAVYLPELAPDDTFTYEVTVWDNSVRAAAENILEASQAFRTKLGAVSTVNTTAMDTSSDTLYAVISDLREDNNLNYGLRPIVSETIDTGLMLNTCGNGSACNVKLTPGEDYEITTITFPVYGGTTGFDNNFSDHADPSVTPQTVTIWGRATESNPWTPYAEVTYSYLPRPNNPRYTNWHITNVEPVNGASLAGNITYPANPSEVTINLPAGIGQTRQTYLVNNSVSFQANYYITAKIKANGETVQTTLDNISGRSLILRNYSAGFYYFAENATDALATTPEANDLLYSNTANVYATIEKAPEFTAQTNHGLSSDLTSSLNTEQTYFTLSNNINLTTYPGRTNLTGFGSTCIYSEKIASGEWKHVTHGKFYSLQAPGARVDKNSITLKKTVNGNSTWVASEGEIVDIQIINNWRGSGRQMLIVEVDNLPQYTPTPDCNRDTTGEYASNIDTARLTFTSYYSIEDYIIYNKQGDNKNLYRYDSFENLSDDTIGYSTANPTYTNGAPDTSPTSSTWKDVAPYMSDLNNLNDDAPTFLYTNTYRNLSANPQILSDFTKAVTVGDETHYLNTAWMAPNQEYSYALRFYNDSRIQETGIVLFDSIETYQPPGKEDHARFTGHLRGINLSLLRFQGVEPVLYVSQIDELDVQAHSDVSDESVWIRIEDTETLDDMDMDTITAFAIDCSKDTNGDEFILEPDNLLMAEIYMQAPTREEARAKGNLTADSPVAYVYNDSYLTAVKLGDDDSRTPISNYFEHTTLALHDPTIVLKAGKGLAGRKLAEGQFTFGVYDDNNELVASGTNTAEGEIEFTPITYTSTDIGQHTYTVREITTSQECAHPYYTCDTTQYTITVDVIAAGDSVTAIATYPTGIEYSSDNSPYLPPISQPDNEGLPAFINHYTSNGDSVPITARKEIQATGDTPVPRLHGGEFNFTLFDETGAVVAEATNDETGLIDFGVLSFTQDDIDIETSTAQLHYTIKETSCEAFWICDTHTETITINLVDNGTGTITTTVSYDNNGAVFTNTYSEPPATRTSVGHTLPAWLLPLLFALTGGITAHTLTRKHRKPH